MTSWYDSLDTEDDEPIGYAENPPGVAFRCGTCEYFDAGTCRNPRKKLNGVKVKGDVGCCNWYESEGMKTVIP